ncbi:hypothetical protein KCH_37570 [Kitasatospora cheerisanensis KCTC 2395]|uniref:Uncharacterized protein n=1 Tax=Kitasatospora cheerisanensis KCTC 2395 TaxID=1348663 RepID=A0A066Z0U3_9ACTN|nr:hypothetical protein KCH_37570 [Kitasatospora cheerisanensis KCTC 2395]
MRRRTFGRSAPAARQRNARRYQPTSRRRCQHRSAHRHRLNGTAARRRTFGRLVASGATPGAARSLHATPSATGSVRRGITFPAGPPSARRRASQHRAGHRHGSSGTP